MNAKAKKYYQDINKENHLSKQYKNRGKADRELTKGSCQVLGTHNQSRLKGMSPGAKIQIMKKVESKKNIIGRYDYSKDKYGVVRFPKIIRDETPSHNSINKKNRCRSFKKMVTQPAAEPDEDLFNIRTLSPKDNIKQVLLGIVKNKQNRHLASIDEEIDKLDILTRRYSCLRKDLSSIQEDILTMSFKHRMGGKDSESASSVYLN